MSHRMGSLITLGTPVTIGPDGGTAPDAANTWTATFSPPAAAGGTKFLMLHFSGGLLPGSNRVEVNVGYGVDVFTSSSGADFWSRPVAGNSVTIRYIDDGAGPPSGKVDLVQYGRGEGLSSGGATNTNGDIFLLASPYVDPTYFNPNGVCPSGASPSWENVAVLPPGVMRDTARSVGMLVMVHDGALATCSGALIGPDLVLTAGHCIPSAIEHQSGSFTVDFQTNADGTRPTGYDPIFHKVLRVVQRGTPRAPGDTRPSLDYCILQIVTPPPGVGAAPLTVRSSVPTMGEELFVIHHPRGATKKVSRRPTDPSCSVNPGTNESVLYYACDSDNGSSGSPVLDTSGRIVAVNDWAPGSCSNAGQTATKILQDIATAPAPPADVDVVVVLDRSGSMSLPGVSGATKMREAQQAAAMFVDLVRTDRTHRVALVSFSTAAGIDSGLAQVTPSHKDVLIGPAPARDAGVIGGLAAGGMTSIGGGLRLGQMQLPAGAANTPAMLLMTDGLQNTPPMIGDVQHELGGTNLSIVGFGTEANLDGPLLTRLARDHSGIYARAGDGLALKKFFVLAFGNMFHTGIALDPEYVMKAGVATAEPIPLFVCGESNLVVALGWEHATEDLTLELLTPGGTTVSTATPGVVASSGDTWVHMRLPLPFGAERDGEWKLIARRRERILSARGESSAGTDERFFVTAAVDGGPQLRPIDGFRHYTGDAFNPQVELRYPTGEHVHGAQVALEVLAPDGGTGNILMQGGLREGTATDGDEVGARAATLIAMEDEKGSPLIGYRMHRFELFDDGEHADGALEPDGVFGNVLKGLTRQEGTYSFRARAEFGEACTATREVSWSVYVGVAIDPDKTMVTSETVGTLADGRAHVRLTFTPRDAHGNYLGPGRLDAFDVAAQPGSDPIGGAIDHGDGTYTQDVAWEGGSPPQISVTQEERPPVVLAPGKGKSVCPPWLWWLLILGWFLLVVLLIVVVLSAA